MRRLTISVPEGHGRAAMKLAADRGATDVLLTAAKSGGQPRDVVELNVGNSGVEPLVDALEPLPDVRISFAPRGVLALRPPASAAPQQVTDVEPRSALEIYLGGLQSIGSWRALLGYAVAAGFVVWIGLFTERSFLLTAAMLIAPFASPALNAALATARGDRRLFGRSLLRYFVALAVTVLVSFALSKALHERIATDLMAQTSLISSVAVLLPLVAGAAGALNLCQSDRSSLVSGAATGMLVAASLAPPAGLVGMGAAIGEWDIVKSAAFLLLLQVTGINLSGSIVFRLYGVSAQGGRYPAGDRASQALLWGGSLVALLALLGWQFSSPPDLLRSTTAQRAASVARQAVQDGGVAQPVQIDASFTRADIPGQDTLLVKAFVQAPGDKSQVESAVRDEISQRLTARFHVTPLVSVTVLTR